MFQIRMENECIPVLTIHLSLFHEVNEDSPLWGIEEAFLKDRSGAISIIIEAYDEDYSQTTCSSKVYHTDFIKFDRTFENVIYTDKDTNERYFDARFTGELAKEV